MYLIRFNLQHGCRKTPLKKLDFLGKVLVKTFLVILFASYTGSAIASLVDLTGPAPEESSIIITVNKPADASKGLITLFVNDADMADEGELVINGNPAIPLFGSAGSVANDGKSTNITISTPASYWRDGYNKLLFKHTRTGGYVIYDVTVQFEVSPPAPTEPPVVDGLFPVDLTGSAPEESSIKITVNKPADANKGLITLLVYDADIADEGELVINGHPAIPLFGTAGSGANDAKSTNITISTPASYWQDGNNTLIFRHTRTGGYIIYDMTVQFEVSTQPGVTGSVNLSWIAPVARTDETALALSEIAGYTVYYGTSMGNYSDSLIINDGSATVVTITDLPVGIYYLVLTTRDTDGRESEYSSMATIQTQ